MPKRPRSGDPPPSRRVRTRTMGLLPTPDDDALSAADPSSSSLSDPPSSSLPDPWAPSASPAAQKVPPSPANPGIVRNRHKGVLTRLPPDCDILEVVARLRRDQNLSDEQLILQLMSTYDVTLATLNQISGNVYPSLLYRNLSNIIDEPQPQDCPHRLATLNMTT
jgi:hypothetical protein